MFYSVLFFLLKTLYLTLCVSEIKKWKRQGVFFLLARPQDFVNELREKFDSPAGLQEMAPIMKLVAYSETQGNILFYRVFSTGFFSEHTCRIHARLCVCDIPSC